MGNVITCTKCGKVNPDSIYFCSNCGAFLKREMITNAALYETSEIKIQRILGNLQKVPHAKVIWDDTIDLYTKKVERYRALMDLPEFDNNNDITRRMDDFLELCTKPEFQIAFVGTIKTGKSTLINSLLGYNYASMAVTPETAALTKFRSSPKDYVRITFYSPAEWKTLWKSVTSGADTFIKEYKDLNAEKYRQQWIGHEPIYKELPNSDIKRELSVWSSSKSPEHYFVKEIEVGISSLSRDFPKQVVLVDTPGLSDPVVYRSEITKKYIRKANAVFVCVDSTKVQKDEIETISSVFSFSSHNKSKVHIIATHWDKLNRPVSDWEEQKKWLEKRLVGKGFFDTHEMAHTNIMHSAAHIYNLCRDYNTLEKDDKITLMQFALGMGIDISKMEESLPEMMRLTNIDNIKNIVTNVLAKNYQALLSQDIEKKYLDIVHTLRRITAEEQKELHTIIEVSNSDIDKMREKVAEQKRNYDEINASRIQLTRALESVESSTKKRLTAILSLLDATTKNYEI